MKKRAFSLLELIVVIVIIAVIAAIAIPSFNNATERAKDETAAASLASIARNVQALRAFTPNQPFTAEMVDVAVSETAGALSAGQYAAGNYALAVGSESVTYGGSGTASTRYAEVGLAFNDRGDAFGLSMKTATGACVYVKAAQASETTWARSSDKPVVCASEFALTLEDASGEVVVPDPPAEEPLPEHDLPAVELTASSSATTPVVDDDRLTIPIEANAFFPQDGALWGEFPPQSIAVDVTVKNEGWSFDDLIYGAEVMANQMVSSSVPAGTGDLREQLSLKIVEGVCTPDNQEYAPVLGHTRGPTNDVFGISGSSYVLFGGAEGRARELFSQSSEALCVVIELNPVSDGSYENTAAEVVLKFTSEEEA